MTHALRTKTSSNIYGDGGETRTQTETGTPRETIRQLEVLTVQTGMGIPIRAQLLECDRQLQEYYEPQELRRCISDGHCQNCILDRHCQRCNLDGHCKRCSLPVGVTPSMMALEGGGPTLGTTRQKHAVSPLLSGGGGASDTAGQQNGGPPASDVVVPNRTIVGGGGGGVDLTEV